MWNLFHEFPPLRRNETKSSYHATDLFVFRRALDERVSVLVFRFLCEITMHNFISRSPSPVTMSRLDNSQSNLILLPSLFLFSHYHCWEFFALQIFGKVSRCFDRDFFTFLSIHGDFANTSSVLNDLLWLATSTTSRTTTTCRLFLHCEYLMKSLVVLTGISLHSWAYTVTSSIRVVYWILLRCRRAQPTRLRVTFFFLNPCLSQPPLIVPSFCVLGTVARCFDRDFFTFLSIHIDYANTSSVLNDLLCLVAHYWLLLLPPTSGISNAKWRVK